MSSITLGSSVVVSPGTFRLVRDRKKEIGIYLALGKRKEGVYS